jgi:hypothetical protein
MALKSGSEIISQDQPPTWDTIRANLMTRKRAVYAELSAYPRQIAGCDIQFQLLSEKRDALIAAIARLDAARDSGATPTVFIESAPNFDAPHP